MKRIFCLVASVFLLISAVGCEKIDLSGGKQTAKKPAEETETVLTVKTTLSGTFSFRPDAGISPQADRILAKIEETEQKTGCVIDVETVRKETLSAAFLRAGRSGSKYADLIQTDAGALTEYQEQGLLYSLNDAGIPFSQTGVLRSGDVSYALRADGWNHPLPTASYLLYYNENCLSEINAELPMELYEKEAWDWDHFIRIAKNVTRLSADGNVFALSEPTAADPTLMWATLYAAGAMYYTGDACTMDSEATRFGFAKLKELSDQKLFYRLRSEDNETGDETPLLAFTNRRTAFLPGNAALLYDAGENSISSVLQENLRVIAFPQIPGGRKNTVSFTEEDLFCSLTANANLSLCQKVLPLLFEAPGGTDPKKDLTEQYFFNEKDGALYQELLSAAGTDTKLRFGEDLSTVEEYFLQIVNGASAKELLSNLELIFNAKKG